MFFSACLYIALAIFGFGLLFKVSSWFRYTINVEAQEITVFQRVYAAIKGIILTIFSSEILTLLRVFFLDVLFQGRILKEDVLRWFMHMCIFGGFILLLLMHALDAFITSTLFPDYSSTLNPFLFLRNLFGAFVILGLAIAAYRRFFQKQHRFVTNVMDHYAMMILAVVMVTGIFLEGSKIVSYTRYQGMVEDYADSDEKEELRALESYWVKSFGVVSPKLKGPFDENLLAQGKELHEMSCAACHSRPQWATMSYGVAKGLQPVAVGLDKINLSTVLWYIHFLSSFIGLAYLPFSRMLHIFTSPLSLLVNAVMDKEKSDLANIATRQIMELDACTHCGICSSRCAVAVSLGEIPNVNILPSEKIASLKAFAAGKKLSKQEFMSIQEGLYLCTNCYRCTAACPVGINLQDLWFDVRETLLQKGYPEFLILSPLSFYRGLKSDDIGDDRYRKPIQMARKAIEDEYKLPEMHNTIINSSHTQNNLKRMLRASVQGNTFSYCFTCTTCSTACPVVHNFEKSKDSLGLVPHQIIRAAIIGIPDLIFSSNMLWYCLGCYECQEHCPQGVRVTDVFYELKNLAIKHVKGKATNT
jgi:heterodisulfide reductase subunit C